MTDGRKRARTRPIARTSLFAALIVAIGAAFLVAPTPAEAKPDIEKVKAKVERLEHEAEIASERYNTAKVKAVDLKTQLDSLNADLHREQTVVDRMRLNVASEVVDQYQASALSVPAQMMLSSNPDAFLDNLNAISTYNSQQGERIGNYAVELRRLTLRKAAVKQEAARLDDLQAKMLHEKQIVDSRAEKAKGILDDLEAKARQEMLAGSTSGPVPNVAASGRAAAAVHYAMAQVGKAYVYGAAGPNAFDCSGLTMAAWGVAGVGLPHSSSAQTGSGRSVSESELQPGDLVFYYSPVSHVGMYIGNGLIVNALNPREGVKVSGLHDMPYSGAVRPG